MAHIATDQTLKALIDAIAPAKQAFRVTPNDSAVFDPPLKSFRVAGAGTVRVRAEGSDAPVNHPVLDGEYVPLRAAAILAAGTTPDLVIIGYR